MQGVVVYSYVCTSRFYIWDYTYHSTGPAVLRILPRFHSQSWNGEPLCRVNLLPVRDRHLLHFPSTSPIPMGLIIVRRIPRPASIADPRPIDDLHQAKKVPVSLLIPASRRHIAPVVSCRLRSFNFALIFQPRPPSRITAQRRRRVEPCPSARGRLVDIALW